MTKKRKKSVSKKKKVNNSSVVDESIIDDYVFTDAEDSVNLEESNDSTNLETSVDEDVSDNMSDSDSLEESNDSTNLEVSADEDVSNNMSDSDSLEESNDNMEIDHKKDNSSNVDDISDESIENDINEDGYKLDNNEVRKKGIFSNKLFIVLICFAFSFFCAVSFYLLKKDIYFSYDGLEYTIDVFSDFINPNVNACYGNRFKCKDIDVVVSSDVNSSKLGNYSITYSAKYNKKFKDLVINVNVVDTEVPVIDVSSDSLSVCPNATSYNIDYKAYDNYDGDVSSNVGQSVDSDLLVLSVSDSSSNIGTKNINLVREDLEAPSISLNGNSTMYLPIGSSFSDPGFSANDNCDGDVSSDVSISGVVDTSKAGGNNVTYTVSDSSGNSISVTRNVYVYAPNGNGDKVIYLTFDDGPSGYTGELLDILARYNVKATFFVTNRNPGYNYFIKRAYDEGHTIALHTSTHNYGQIYSSVDAYFNDLNAINETVKDITGSYSYLLRFPGGSSNTVSRNYSSGIMTTLSRMVTERGYKYFDWNVSSGDASGVIMSSSQYANNIINGISGKSMSIVLQHDTNINSIRSVGTVIEYGLSHGYSFRALDMSSPVVHHGIAN